MNLNAQIDGVENAALPSRPLHLAIGMFDGVHLGHRAVIDEAVRSARTDDGVAAVLTFWPHPSVLFRPTEPVRQIVGAAEKARLLLGIGVNAVITQPFTREFAAVAAEDFLRWLRERLPRLAAIYVGENFRFGAGRRGDVSLLRAGAPPLGLRVFSAPRVNHGGAPVSSTRIRALLEAGEIDKANELLGRAYAAEGPVMPGKHLGRTIGFPTLNVAWAPDLRPRFGVYAVRVSGDRAVEVLPAVANYGVRPTVEDVREPRLEAHVLGPCPFGEGDRVKVEWVRFLRPEMKFPGLPELTAQIGRDRAAAREFFGH